MSSDVPSWAEIMREAIRANREELYTSLPGRVKSYHATKKAASIELQVKRVIRKRDGSTSEKAFPILPNVPVGQPAGGGYFVHMPVTDGDFVMVHFAMRSLDVFRSKGSLAVPADKRLHDLAFGWAQPCYDISAPPEDAETGLVIGKVGGPVVHIDATTVNLGDAAASAPVALSTKLDAVGNAIAVIPPATNPSTTMANVNAVIAAFAAAFPGGLGSVAASKVKAT